MRARPLPAWAMPHPKEKWAQLREDVRTGTGLHFEKGTMQLIRPDDLPGKATWESARFFEIVEPQPHATGATLAWGIPRKAFEEADLLRIERAR